MEGASELVPASEAASSIKQDSKSSMSSSSNSVSSSKDEQVSVESEEETTLPFEEPVSSALKITLRFGCVSSTDIMESIVCTLSEFPAAPP